VDGCKAHVGYFVEFFQAAHDHLADFRGSQLTLGGLVYDAFNLVHDGFKFRCSYRAFLASLEQALQNFLTLEALSAAVFLGDHVGNFVDAFVGGESARAFEAFAAAPDGVAGAAFARIDHLIVNVGAERALHSGSSPDRSAADDNLNLGLRKSCLSSLL